MTLPDSPPWQCRLAAAFAVLLVAEKTLDLSARFSFL
jgi:hypothetical protein